MQKFIVVPCLIELFFVPDVVLASRSIRLLGLPEHFIDMSMCVRRVYTKPKGKLPDFDDPVVLQRSKCTVEGFCNRIHKMIMKNFKFALVWGVSSKHRPQRVGKDHVLQDEDIVQIVKGV